MSTKYDFDIKLIELVRPNPILYEQGIRLKPYELMKTKAEIWRSIGSSLGVESQLCTARWKHLRDRFRNELKATEEMARKAAGAGEIAKGSNWHLMDKLRFLESHLLPIIHRKKSAENTHSSWNEIEAEQFIDQVINNDDTFQEAMEYQASGPADCTEIKDFETLNAQQIAPQPTAAVITPTPAYIRRIETLLEGMDNTNRTRAEKRIVAYLCKCKLKTLNNEGIDDVVI